MGYAVKGLMLIVVKKQFPVSHIINLMAAFDIAINEVDSFCSSKIAET